MRRGEGGACGLLDEEGGCIRNFHHCTEISGRTADGDRRLRNTFTRTALHNPKLKIVQYIRSGATNFCRGLTPQGHVSGHVSGGASGVSGREGLGLRMGALMRGC